MTSKWVLNSILSLIELRNIVDTVKVMSKIKSNRINLYYTARPLSHGALSYQSSLERLLDGTVVELHSLLFGS